MQYQLVKGLAVRRLCRPYQNVRPPLMNIQKEGKHLEISKQELHTLVKENDSFIVPEIFVH